MMALTTVDLEISVEIVHGLFAAEIGLFTDSVRVDVLPAKRASPSLDRAFYALIVQETQVRNVC